MNVSCLLDVNRSLCAPAGRTRFPDICLRGCAYTLLQTVQSHEVYSDAYGTVHYHDYKEPLKLFEIRIGHIPPFVAILP